MFVQTFPEIQKVSFCLQKVKYKPNILKRENKRAIAVLDPASYWMLLC